MAPTATMERLCKRFGPGRLPGAGNRAIGAGYAVATAAVSAAALFVVMASGYELLTMGSGEILFGFRIGGFLTLYGLAAIPIVIPSAFLAGVVVWRTLSEATPYYGPIGGVLATVLTYVIATALVAGVLVPYFALNRVSTLDPMGAPLFAGVIGVVGFIYTCWLTVPLGALSGHIHEQAVEAE